MKRPKPSSISTEDGVFWGLDALETEPYIDHLLSLLGEVRELTAYRPETRMDEWDDLLDRINEILEEQESCKNGNYSAHDDRKCQEDT